MIEKIKKCFSIIADLYTLFLDTQKLCKKSKSSKNKVFNLH